MHERQADCNIGQCQCDQIGLFLKCLGFNFFAKVAKIFDNLWAPLKNNT